MPRRRRLKTIVDVRRYLAHLIHSTEAGEIDPQTAGRLAYISNILLRAIEGGDLERRVDALEKKINH
ncbi:MAG: hypothetical protein GTO24_23095 [candidate division Zixibacteria bacterium]|nr:hypothetical protein [candidate division Zixibacteria bacterium]